MLDMKITPVYLGVFLLGPLLLVACEQNSPQYQSASGIYDFKRAVVSAYERLAFKKIRKKDGFYNECSVEFDMNHGIRVSETVCNVDEDALEVTIRVTDPATRPPSQRRLNVSVELEKYGLLTLSRGIPEKTDSGVMLLLDRTGQSVILTARVDR